MINVLLFAQVRELTGVSQLTVENHYPTAEALRSELASRGDRWAMALERGKLLCAVNQSLVGLDHPLVDGDEVAFFPPVTGG